MTAETAIEIPEEFLAAACSICIELEWPMHRWVLLLLYVGFVRKNRGRCCFDPLSNWHRQLLANEVPSLTAR